MRFKTAVIVPAMLFSFPKTKSPQRLSFLSIAGFKSRRFNRRLSVPVKLND
jgi:hypothetical protein